MREAAHMYAPATRKAGLAQEGYSKKNTLSKRLNITMIPSDAVAIGIGAFLGAMSRHHIGVAAADWIASNPNRFGGFHGWHTAAINIGGSFLLGSITGIPLAKSGVNGLLPPPKASSYVAPSRLSPFPSFTGLSPRAKLMMGVGFCGSFTTFSTYSVDIVSMVMKGETAKACSYILVNNLGGVLAATSGLMLVQKALGAAKR